MDMKIYNLSDEKRILILDKKVVIQIYRAGFDSYYGSYLGCSWYNESILTMEEFKNLKKLLTE